MKPFLRWAGGKSRIVEKIAQYVPTNIDQGTYWEPFLGAGSLYLHIAPRQAILSDSNLDLINCSSCIKANPEAVFEHLQKHLNCSSEAYYYKLRVDFNNNSREDLIMRAAAFIYLNRASFNGIWRVNQNGHFNVPYGHKDPPPAPSLNTLKKASKLLATAKIIQGDYNSVLENVGTNDFVYLDPPYPPLNATSNFTHYTQDRFDINDHRALAELAFRLARSGTRVLISNAGTDDIHKLYSHRIFHKFELNVTRWLKTDGERYRTQELLITTYEPPNLMMLDRHL
jgi:DNA adenine methylase